MAIVLKEPPSWALTSYREPRANWSYEDETQRCIVVDIGEIDLARRAMPAPGAILFRFKVVQLMRDILSQVIPVGQLWVGSEMVVRFDEFESTMIKNKYIRDDIYIRAILAEVVFAQAMKGTEND